MLAAALGGCRQPEGGPTPPDTTGPTAPKPDTEASAPADDPPSEGTCGPPGASLGDYGWAPARVAVLASLDLTSSGIDAAIDHLSVQARAGADGLPIEVAFALSQWSWEVPLVRATLRQAGFEPGELVYLRTSEGLPAWVWRSPCDLDDAVARVESTWGVQVRRTVSAAIGSSREGAGTFAFDVVFTEGERVALAPAGRGAALSDALARAAATPPDPDGPTPMGGVLAAVDPAPVRAVIGGRALLGTEGKASTATSLRRIRADANGVEIAATMPPP